MRIRIHSNSRVDVLNLKRKAYKKGKDIKPYKEGYQLHGKRRSIKSKRIARRKTTKPEWLAGRGATSYPASTSSSCSEKSPKDEIADEDDLDGLNHTNRNHLKSHGHLGGEKKAGNGIGKCMENDDDEGDSSSSDSESSDSDSSSTSNSSSSCSNYSYSDESDSDSDGTVLTIPISTVAKSSSKRLPYPLDRVPGHQPGLTGSDKENSKPPRRKLVVDNRACCTSREVLQVHYKSPLLHNSDCESVQPGTGSKNLSFLMQHLADRIRGDRGREAERAVKPNAPVHAVHSRKKHLIRTQQKETYPHDPRIHCLEHCKHGKNKNTPSVTPLVDPNLNSDSHEHSPTILKGTYFPNFENIADFDEIPRTFEDFDMSMFHEFKDCEERFALEWELVDELVRDDLKEPKSGSYQCQCQDESKIKQEAIKEIEEALKRIES